jgi:hypothetical protein
LCAATVLYTSWNGATEVTGWQANHRYAAVTALTRSGRRLKRSPVIKI